MAVPPNKSFRKTTQDLAPARYTPASAGQYDLYPSYPIPRGSIHHGFEALAALLPVAGPVAIDGYEGVFWEDFRGRFDAALCRRGVKARWIDVSEAWKPEAEIDRLVRPYLGGDDPIFGTRFTGSLEDFFSSGLLTGLRQPGEGLTIWYGIGAALVRPDAWLVYLDLPKNELQFRARAATVKNLGASRSDAPKPMYKRFYFVDWPALNRHKKEIAHRVSVVVDCQRPDDPAAITGEDWRHALASMARNYFRVRPWFEPGPWGGQWCRKHIPSLPDAPNYAWSFELITPENGLLFRDSDRLLETSFDWLMYRHGSEVLGDCASLFGDEFPIRYDFLDTFDGGNLSIQVHPRPDYIRSVFGERFTQDECYYILDAGPGARVNLGFQEGVHPADFRRVLETSFREGSRLDADAFVQSHPSRKHDFFLIPHGTIHGSGIDNLVLEISATPYIFTFKLYDWLRPDLDGKPRPLNIDRGMKNLDFSRQGARVAQEHISRPQVIASGPGWQTESLPTHPDHFYQVFRYRFEREFEASTEGSAHVMSLVDGRQIELQTAEGQRTLFNYAETFVVPSRAGEYRLVNRGETPAMVIMTRIKKEVPASAGL